MATPVDTLLVRVEADLRDVRKSLAQLEKDTKRSADRTSKAFSNIGRGAKILLGGVLARELGNAAKDAVNFASAVEEQQAKSGVVFGAFTDKVRADLAAFGDAVGRSKFELEAMAASVQDTFVPMGIARGDAAELSVALTKLATDVASFNDANDAEVMRAFQSTLVGNHETVRQFGIVITEAELQAELFRMGIVKAKDQVSAAEKIQARYNLILAGTTDAQGDAARTAESYANQVRATNSKIDELKKAIGDRLLPTFTELVKLTGEAADGLTNMITGEQADKANTVAEANKRIAESQKELIRLNKEFQETEGDRRDKKRGQERNRIRQEIQDQQDIIAANRARALELTRIDNQAKAAKAKEDAEKTQEAEASALFKGAEFAKEQTDALALLRLELQGATDAELELAKAQQDGAAFTPEQIATYNAQAEALKKVQMELEGTNEIQESIKAGFENFGKGVSDSITDMVTGVSSGLDGLKDVVRQSINQIISDMIRVHVVNKSINAALGFFGLEDFQIGKASGGAVQGGRPVLVGERGPELIVPKSASTVRNAHDTRSAMARGGAGVAVYQTINVTTGVQDTVKAEIANLMPQISDASKAAVLDARRRGGSFSRAF